MTECLFTIYEALIMMFIWNIAQAFLLFHFRLFAERLICLEILSK